MNIQELKDKLFTKTTESNGQKLETTYGLSDAGIEKIATVDWSGIYNYLCWTYNDFLTDFNRDMAYLRGVSDSLPSPERMKSTIERLEGLANFMELYTMIEAKGTKEVKDE